LNISLYDGAIALHFVQVVLVTVWTFLLFQTRWKVAALVILVIVLLDAFATTVLFYMLSIAGGVLYTLYTLWVIVELFINISVIRNIEGSSE